MRIFDGKPLDGHDMDLVEGMEENVTGSFEQLTRFVEVTEADAVHLYMLRPQPSWANM